MRQATSNPRRHRAVMAAIFGGATAKGSLTAFAACRKSVLRPLQHWIIGERGANKSSRWINEADARWRRPHGWLRVCWDSDRLLPSPSLSSVTGPLHGASSRGLFTGPLHGPLHCASSRGLFTGRPQMPSSRWHVLAAAAAVSCSRRRLQQRCFQFKVQRRKGPRCGGRGGRCGGGQGGRGSQDPVRTGAAKQAAAKLRPMGTAPATDFRPGRGREGSGGSRRRKWTI